MAAPTVNGERLLTAHIEEPRQGLWTATVEVDTSEELADPVTIAIGDTTWVGAIYRGAVYQGRWKGTLVGGAGGLATELGPKFYDGASVNAILGDIFTATGESLDTATLGAVTGHIWAKWQRTRGKASAAIDALVDALNATPSQPGYVWRTTRAGKVLIALDAFATLTFAHTKMPTDPRIDTVTIAPAGEPELVPGVTFDGKEIDHVVTDIGPTKLRQTGWVRRAGGRHNASRIARDLAGLVEAYVGRALRYAYLWPATVTGYDAGSGRAEVLADDERMRGTGSGQILARAGIPGATITLEDGDRVLLGFDAGDPHKPFCVSVEQAVDSGSLKRVAREDDSAQAGWLIWDSATSTLYYASEGPVSGVPGSYAAVVANPNTPNSPPDGTIGTPLIGDITSGSDRASLED